jgi:cold shock protein
MQGRVKFWSERGFAFIAPDDGSPDVFVHVYQVGRAGYAALERGQVVRFDVRTNRRNGKLEAVDLELVEPIVSPRLERHHHREHDDDDDRLLAIFGPRR